MAGVLLSARDFFRKRENLCKCNWMTCPGFVREPFVCERGGALDKRLSLGSSVLLRLQRWLNLLVRCIAQSVIMLRLESGEPPALARARNWRRARRVSKYPMPSESTGLEGWPVSFIAHLCSDGSLHLSRKRHRDVKRAADHPGFLPSTLPSLAFWRDVQDAGPPQSVARRNVRIA